MFAAWSVRRNYIGARPAKFQHWWRTRTAFARRASLFMLTIMFMPVARSLLSVFHCVCEDDEGSATTCHLAPYDDEPCLPENVLPIHVRAVCGRYVLKLSSRCLSLEIKAFL